MSNSLSGKVAIITGGANGIGETCAITLSQAGVRVVIADANPEAAVQRAAAISESTGVEVIAVETDVSDPEQCQRMVHKATDHFAQVNILINCAGIYVPMSSLELDVASWMRTFDINLHGTYFCSQAFAQQVVKQETNGVIVNLSSVASTHNYPRVAAYCASKAALNSLTKTLALEWAPYNIRVNAVAPSHVNTPRIRSVAAEGKMNLEAIANSNPMKRLAERQEIADAVMFLCGEKSSFITGQIICVDGGFSINPLYR